MGIKKLFTFLDDKGLFIKYSYLNNIIKDLNKDKNNFIIGVDANLYCYKYSYSYGNMLIGFYNQILKFYSNNIIPIYIFDGGIIKEKELTNINRNKKIANNKQKIDELNENANTLNNESDLRNLEIIKNKLQKKSVKITNMNLKLLLELFDLLNIPFIFSHCEGEYLAVLLNKLNIIDMFLTDDTDPIPGGIKKLVKFYNNNVYYLNCETMLQQLNLTNNELIDMCILMGNDYNNFYHKIDPNIIYKNIQQHKSIENIIINVNNEDNANSEQKQIEFYNFINENNLNLNNVNIIRNIYKELYNFERDSFINIHTNNFNVNKITNHEDINNYSFVMLEFWNDYIEILKQNDEFDTHKSDKFKNNINMFVKTTKFNISKIIKFMKNNVEEITSDEIKNVITTFEYLNEFGIENQQDC